MDKVIKQWKQVTEKVWKGSGNELKEIEKGYALYNGTIEWESCMYQEIISLFDACEYVYCYEIKRDSRNQHYIDFSHQQQEYRIVFWEENKEMHWNVVPMQTKTELRYFDQKELTWLYDTMMNLLEKMKKMPKYRVKLALRELSIRESSRFFDVLKKAGITLSERRGKNAVS